jgi:hypothetical protein
MTLAIATITDSITALVVDDLIIKDTNQIPAAGNQRSAMLIPRASDFMSEVSMERDSFGGGSSAKMTFYYVLTYRLLYCPIGKDRTNILAPFGNMIAMIGAIWDAVLAVDVLAGCVDIVPNGIAYVGSVADPSDTPYWGADFSFRITEFVN